MIHCENCYDVLPLSVHDECEIAADAVYRYVKCESCKAVNEVSYSTPIVIDSYFEGDK